MAFNILALLNWGISFDQNTFYKINCESWLPLLELTRIDPIMLDKNDTFLDAKSSCQNKAIGTKILLSQICSFWHIAQRTGARLPCQLGTICLLSQPDYNQLCGGNFLSHSVTLSVNAIFHYPIQYCQDTISLWIINLMNALSENCWRHVIDFKSNSKMQLVNGVPEIK